MLHRQQHTDHAFTDYFPLEREGVTVLSRRNMLKAGMAGLAGLSLPGLLAARERAVSDGRPLSRKSVILLWMAGGPSQIDTWDPKPDRPFINRGPFSPIQTNLPGVNICEHLPKQAAMMDHFTLIRSVDPRKSSHQPNQVMQTGNRDATPRTNSEGHMYPAIGSVVSKFHGANDPSMPPYVVFKKHDSHVAWGGYLGKEHDPMVGNRATVLPEYDLVGKPLKRTTGANLFKMPSGLDMDRLQSRRTLIKDFDRLRAGLDVGGSMEALNRYQQQAFDMVLGKRAQQAFDLSREPASGRNKYGEHLWCQQALLARRLVEAGVSFVTLDLSYHTASGTWDNHGIPGGVYGGISKGLKPLLPLFDHLLTTLVSDLEQRGLGDEVLVIAMGEFGRTPHMGTQDSVDGRNHWPVVMSMCLAGGGFRHGQVIGASEADGGQIKERPVTPADLAATIYHHMGVPLDATYDDPRGRPRFIVEENGQPLREII
ncbi:MAG: DUF1501 domain-containing protein [Pirellulaceae bacterium]